MTTEAILAEMEDLADDDRVKRMITLGRQARTDPETAAALGALSTGGFYERRLALLACSGSRDSAFPLQALSDPSRRLRGLALSLVPLLCTETQVQEALEAAPQLGRRMRRPSRGQRSRQAPTDSTLDKLAEDADPQLGPLLAFGSADTVRRHLDSVLARLGADDWQRLARRHPEIAVEALERQAATLTAPDVRLRYFVNAVLPLLAVNQPGPALGLVRVMLEHTSLTQLLLQPLVNHLPNEVCDLVLASQDQTPLRFHAVAHRLTRERLLALVRQKPDSLGSPSHWLGKLPAETRRAVYEMAGLGWRSSEGILDFRVAALLPGELRAAEGRRHLKLPALATRLALRFPYAALLQWDEARSVLEQSFRSPDPDQRGSALSALIGAARFQRERLPEVLALVRARANEQDPIRRAMLAGLANLPPARWVAAHLDDLGQILRDALSAADLSPSTASEAEKLVVALVPFHPEWAADWLGTLAQERGQIYLYGLGSRLNEDDVRRIAPALAPVLASWETRERERFLLQAASSLGRRLRVFPELVAMLERVLTVTPHSYTASQVLGVLSEHRRDRLRDLVPALIRQDPSSVTLPVVYQFLHRRRQDLLTPFLGQAAYSGRFSTGRTRFVLPLTSGFQRWTPSQQATFAQTLNEVTRDADRDAPSVLRAIEQLAALPAVPPARLISLARPAAKPAVRDAALRALARLDSGDGVSTLVEALGDARARIAIYALRTVLLEMPPASALALLLGVPMEKVTVAKEVVRLIGDLKTPGAYPALLALDAQPFLHRDVRIALLRAFWEFLEQDETWPRLERAAADPEPAVAGGVVRIPADRLSPLAQERLVSLIAALLGHPDAKIRLDVLARCVSLPLTDKGRVLMPRLLGALNSRLPDETAAAARAVFATYTGEQAAAVGGAVTAILENRFALWSAVAALKSVLPWQLGRLLPTVRAVIAAMEQDPLTISMRVELSVAGLPWNEMAAQFSQMTQAGEMRAEALMTGVHALERAGSRAAASEGLQSLETALAASPNDELRRLGLAALIIQAGTTEGWTAGLRERLEACRRDPSPLVAAAAQFVFPPDDTEVTL